MCCRVKPCHVTGLEIKNMKIGQVKIDAAAKRIEAQMARDAAEWTAQRAAVVADVRRQEQERNQRAADEQNQTVDEKGPEVTSTGHDRWRKDGEKQAGSDEDVPPTKLISECKKRDANPKPKKGATVLCGLKRTPKGVPRRSPMRRA